MTRRSGWGFALPGLIVIAAVVLAPLCYALVLSFSSYTFLKPTLEHWRLWENFTLGLSDPYLRNSALITGLYVFLTVGSSLLIGLGIATLLAQPLRGKSIYYLIVSLPMLISPVGVALMWRMLLHPQLGIIAYGFSAFGLTAPDWLGDPATSLFTIAAIDVWQQVSFVSLVLLAGLRSVPAEPLEAALVDGATHWQRFVYITLPLLRPVFGVVIILQTISELRTYDLVYVLTRGGPGSSTDLLSYFIYRKSFLSLDLAGASALAFLVMLVTLALVSVYYRTLLQRNS